MKKSSKKSMKQKAVVLLDSYVQKASAQVFEALPVAKPTA